MALAVGLFRRPLFSRQDFATGQKKNDPPPPPQQHFPGSASALTTSVHLARLAAQGIRHDPILIVTRMGRWMMFQTNELNENGAVKGHLLEFVIFSPDVISNAATEARKFSTVSNVRC